MSGHRNVRLNRTVKAAVLTVSDTRDFDTDKGDQCVRQLLQADDVEVSDAYYTIVKDEKAAITARVEKWLEEDTDIIVTTGGTDITQRDMMVEAIKPPLTKEIGGFGEPFRYLSYVEDVGACALLSRAVADTVNNRLVFSILGSTDAVKLTLRKLIKPELNCLIHELAK